jgi:NADH:ubiquinone oxidoreductase subunit F (NADH-binding)
MEERGKGRGRGGVCKNVEVWGGVAELLENGAVSWLSFGPFRRIGRRVTFISGRGAARMLVPIGIGKVVGICALPV